MNGAAFCAIAPTASVPKTRIPWRLAASPRLGRVLQSTDRQGREFATCHDAAMGAMGRRGRLAQLVERLLYTQDVGGSSPSPPTSSKGGRRLEAGREAAVIGAAIDAESAPETEIGL